MKMPLNPYYNSYFFNLDNNIRNLCNISLPGLS